MMVPFSAYALCYIPLAVMILGLLAAFTLTDFDARRIYRRVLPTEQFSDPSFAPPAEAVPPTVQPRAVAEQQPATTPGTDYLPSTGGAQATHGTAPDAPRAAAGTDAANKLPPDPKTQPPPSKGKR